jgi:hypothetical protein
VDISLQKYADLQIDFVNLKHIGMNYEQEI